MKTSFPNLLACFAALLLPLAGRAQVNSGSDGHDGALEINQSISIDMANHPDGIYHYTSVSIPTGVTVSFIPNANNKPVVWLVQGNCVINGTVDVSGKPMSGGSGGLSGPGGWAGGSGGSNPSSGYGPGSGANGVNNQTGIYFGGNASFGTVGNVTSQQQPAGVTYGNSFLLPLRGGSGGGGTASWSVGGSGGGGAIMIASSQSLVVNGNISANGGPGVSSPVLGASGSGGGIRLVAQVISGNGSISAKGGTATGYQLNSFAGDGRVRFDTYANTFSGSIGGVFTQGFQPIILPAAGQGIQLSIASVGGVAAPASPSGVLASPDVIVSAQQVNPIPIVVNCSNIPLNSEITVKVHPANGADVTAVGLNNAGTLATSTATVSVNMPRGGGIIYATAVTGIAGGGASIGSPADAKTPSLAETGWTASGERFVAMEITASLGGKQKIAYLTKSGKRYPAN